MRQSIEIPLNVVSVIALNPVEYEVLKLQVLDCRSNETIKNAKIKKLTINGSLTIENVFEQVDKRINTGNKIKDAQEALNRLGYNHGTVATTFGDKGREQYKLYWEDRAPGQVAEITEGNPPDEMLDFITSEYNSHWGTDDNGILNVRIPINTLDDSTLSINLGFFDFPVLLEELKIDPRSKTPQLLPIRRQEDTTGNGTNYRIEWRDNQNAEWGGNFGWFMVNGHQSDEFKVSLNLTVKDDKNEFSEFNEDLMSFFYNKGNPLYHFNLFAMQWCQPVWDDIEDTNIGNAIRKSYIQDNQLADFRLHIVTRYIGSGNGKTYGTTRHADGDSGVNEAIDIYTTSNISQLFAVHAGKSTCNNTPLSEAGRNVLINWDNRRLRYLHFSSINIQNNTHIMCGCIIGIAGHTGNFSPISERNAANNYQPDSQYPQHVHLDDGYGTHTTGILSNRDEVEVYNRVCIPNYQYPLLFPCFCNVTEEAENPLNCNFQITKFTDSCWAVYELRCPHILGNNNRNRRIQAQLRYLNYNPGTIDGNWGIIPINQQQANTVGGTRRAIYNFKHANSLTAGTSSSFVQEDYEINQGDETLLNQLAPIQV